MSGWCGCPAMASQPVQGIFRVGTHSVIITESVVDLFGEHQRILRVAQIIQGVSSGPT